MVAITYSLKIYSCNKANLKSLKNETTFQIHTKSNKFSVQFDKDGKMLMSNQLQDAPYVILKSRDCKHKTKKYQIVKDSKQKQVDSNKVICAAERDYKDAKVAGLKTKLCYVS